MIVKKHIAEDGRIVLAICDSGLLGKVFEEGKRILDLKSEFYQGEEKTEEEIQEELTKAYLIHAVGKDSVDLLKKQNLVSENSIIKIADIPHAEVIREQQ